MTPINYKLAKQGKFLVYLQVRSIIYILFKIIGNLLSIIVTEYISKIQSNNLALWKEVISVSIRQLLKSGSLESC